MIKFHILSVSAQQEHSAVSWLHRQLDVLSSQVQPAGTQDYCNMANDENTGCHIESVKS